MDDQSASPSLKRQRGLTVTGLVLVIPGIVLYIYILYIFFSMLVYPGSFSPFMSHTLSEATTTGVCVCVYVLL